MDIKIFNKLSELSNKPFSYKFTDKEIKLILEYSDIKNGIAKYCIWKQKRHNDCYILYMLDFKPYRVRKAGFDNSLDVVVDRELTQLEKLEEAQNFGCRNRICKGWNYKYIEQLIEEDKKYNISTPGKFIEYCKNLGYTNPQYKVGSQIALQL